MRDLDWPNIAEESRAWAAARLKRVELLLLQALVHMSRQAGPQSLAARGGPMRGCSATRRGGFAPSMPRRIDRAEPLRRRLKALPGDRRSGPLPVQRDCPVSSMNCSPSDGAPGTGPEPMQDAPTNPGPLRPADRKSRLQAVPLSLGLRGLAHPAARAIGCPRKCRSPTT